METICLGCGCAISRSMFSGREIISINTCMAHASIAEVQAQLVILEEVLVKNTRTVKSDQNV